MRYRDLQIETQRETPARARTDGERLLVRAGYIQASGRLTVLGNRAVARLRQFTNNDPGRIAALDLPTFKTIDYDIVAELSGGEYRLLRCINCGYAAEETRASAAKPPPPPEAPRPIERISTPECRTIEALANFLRVPQSRTGKALLYTRPAEDQLIFVLLRGDMQISEHKLHRVVGDVQLASPSQITAAGAVPGYASPVGLRNAQVLIDDLIPASANLVVGANEQDYHLLNANFGRDFGADTIADLTLACAGDPCVVCGARLQPLICLQVAEGSEIRYPALLLAMAERHRDEKGLMFAVGAAPFDVYLMQLPSRRVDTKATADALHASLEAAGIMVLYDDRDERAGVKFNDADLIGCPLRLTVGERQLENRMVELKSRSETSVESIPIEETTNRLRALCVPS